MTNLPISDTKISELQAQTRDDPALQELIWIIQIGWPDQRSQCPKLALPYWNYRDDLAVVDGLVLIEERIVIPTAARGEMLKRIHVGIVKCKNRAKEVLLWPNMHSRIKEMVSNCPTCLQFRISNPKEPMKSHEVSESPCTADRLAQLVECRDYRAGGRGFKPRPDQHSGSLNNWGESASFAMTSANG